MSAYRELSLKALDKYGGKIVRLGDKAIVNLEDSDYIAVTLVEFLSLDAAQRFYKSTEYQKAITYRVKGAKCTVLIFD